MVFEEVIFDEVSDPQILHQKSEYKADSGMRV
jgi:hypothetical protein